MSDMKSESIKLDPVFIHSSFRTGSTWLWSKFRKNKNAYCYYEVFNEILQDIDIETIQISSSTWNSHHPPGPPYFSEFTPLLKGRGIFGFDREMAVDDFFLEISGDVGRVTKTRDYLMSLVTLAQSNGLTPVLSCTRSIGRIDMIKDIIGGSHILLKRNLFNQWSSYSNQSLNGNHFFLREMISSILASPENSFLCSVKGLLNAEIDLNSPSNHDYDNLLITFLSLHLYLYAKHRNDFDLVLDFGAEKNSSSLEQASTNIQILTNLKVDISDYNETISAPQKLVFDIDRVASMVRSLFAAGIPGVDEGSLSSFIDGELETFKNDVARYREIAGSAHLHFDAATENYQRIIKELQSNHTKISDLLESEIEHNTLLKSRLEDAEIKSADLSRDLDEVNSVLNQEREKLEIASEKTSQSTNELNKLNNDINELRIELNSALKHIRKLEKDLTNAGLTKVVYKPNLVVDENVRPSP